MTAISLIARAAALVVALAAAAALALLAPAVAGAAGPRDGEPRCADAAAADAGGAKGRGAKCAGGDEPEDVRPTQEQTQNSTTVPASEATAERHGRSDASVTPGGAPDGPIPVAGSRRASGTDGPAQPPASTGATDETSEYEKSATSAAASERTGEQPAGSVSQPADTTSEPEAPAPAAPAPAAIAIPSGGVDVVLPERDVPQPPVGDASGLWVLGTSVSAQLVFAVTTEAGTTTATLDPASTSGLLAGDLGDATPGDADDTIAVATAAGHIVVVTRTALLAAVNDAALRPAPAPGDSPHPEPEAVAESGTSTGPDAAAQRPLPTARSAPLGSAAAASVATDPRGLAAGATVPATAAAPGALCPSPGPLCEPVADNGAPAAAPAVAGAADAGAAPPGVAPGAADGASNSDDPGPPTSPRPTTSVDDGNGWRGLARGRNVLLAVAAVSMVAALAVRLLQPRLGGAR